MPSSEAGARAAVMGWGVAVIPELLARPHLDAGALVAIRPEVTIDVALYWHQWKLGTGIDGGAAPVARSGLHGADRPVPDRRRARRAAATLKTLPMLILETDRLRLRWFTPTDRDADFLRGLLNDPGWLANIGERNVRTRRQAKTWIATRHTATYGRLGFGFWAVERKSDGALLGMCGLIKRDTLLEVDVGYALMPEFRGHGYAHEAAAACVRYAQDVLGLAEVWGITGTANAPSAGVLQHIGLRDAGMTRLVGSEEDTWMFKSRRRDVGDDRAQVDALTRRFLAAFTNRDGTIPTLPALPHYFMLDATVRVADALGTVTTTEVHGFIAPRAELLVGGRLVDFEEHETESRTEIQGAIAHRWLRYAKRGTLDGVAFEGGGTKSLQFVRTAREWKIASLVWTDDAGAAQG